MAFFNFVDRNFAYIALGYVWFMMIVCSVVVYRHPEARITEPKIMVAYWSTLAIVVVSTAFTFWLRWYLRK